MPIIPPAPTPWAGPLSRPMWNSLSPQSCTTCWMTWNKMVYRISSPGRLMVDVSVATCLTEHICIYYIVAWLIPITTHELILFQALSCTIRNSLSRKSLESELTGSWMVPGPPFVLQLYSIQVWTCGPDSVMHSLWLYVWLLIVGLDNPRLQAFKDS